MRIGLKPGQWGWRFPELRRAWAATEEAGFASLWCLDHVTAAPTGIASWEASALLVTMAAATRRIAVGVMVFNAGLRHPFLLAAAVAVAQAASGGRVRVGLGAGSGLAKADHQALGLPFRAFPERVRRLEACCRLLPALWRRETVSDEDVGLHRASLGPIGIEPPPLIVGGRTGGILRVAARHADGWNLVTDDPEALAAASRRLAQMEAEEGRARPLVRSVQVFLRRLPRERLPSLLEGFQAAGAEEVILVLESPSRCSDHIGTDPPGASSQPAPCTSASRRALQEERLPGDRLQPQPQRRLLATRVAHDQRPVAPMAAGELGQPPGGPPRRSPRS